MREILFRGKRLDNGEWVEGYCAGYGLICHGEPEDTYNATGNYCGQTPYVGFIEVNPATVGQYTGLKDKNGKRIFEGDICRFREWSKGDMCWIGKVHYEHQQFVISGSPNKECNTPFLLAMSRFVPENIEIVGNIHDNPELLGGDGDE